VKNVVIPFISLVWWYREFVTDLIMPG